MIRPLIFCTLLGASAIVLAQPLYKWVEPDGSITFSVKPPENGVDYETINTTDSASADTPKSTEATRARLAPAAQEIVPMAPPAQPAQRIAPQLSIQAQSPRAIQPVTQPATQTSTAQVRDPISRQVARPVNSSEAGVSLGSSEQAAVMTARNRKQRQCEDLQKRVVSLERRLKTRLTPEDMDNTVVHMARYQRSFDQHCAQ